MKQLQELEATEFIGYDQYKTESIIKKIICNEKIVNKIKQGDQAAIILNQTPFYGESGGQVGDKGILLNKNFNFIVNDTTKIFGNFIFHWGEVTEVNVA